LNIYIFQAFQQLRWWAQAQSLPFHKRARTYRGRHEWPWCCPWLCWEHSKELGS